ncbi:MAG: DUF5591 domain-containing protein [Nitrososphaerota archaeon]|nr:DUF5591 domain-containing protein [Thermoproteota archaeon]
MSKYNIVQNKELIFRNPLEVYNGLISNRKIQKWHEFISYQYLPPYGKSLILFYPCSAVKPYPSSRMYLTLFKTLSNLGEKRKLIHVITVSEPFALVPEEYYDKKTEWYDWENDWYECPGLFEWWCRRNKTNYDKKYADMCIDILSNVIAGFLKRLKSKEEFSNIRLVGFVRTYSSSLKVTRNNTHRIMLEEASKRSQVKMLLLPTRKFISYLIKKRGRVAWDFYGVSHPFAQKYLLAKIKQLL